MVKNCSEKKFRFRKRYLLLLVLVVIVILAFCWCGRGGIVSSEAAAQVTAIDIQGDANQTIVQLIIADGALPQAQWRTLEAGEDTYSVQGLAPDPQCISNLPKSAFAAGRCFERFSECCEKSVFEELQFVEMHKKHLVLYAKNAIIRHSLYKCPCAALCGAGREAV